MKWSPSILLIRRFAAAEMAAADFKEIQPEHLLMALLKLAEMPAGEAQAPDVDDELGKNISDEVVLLHEALERCGIESTRTRRRLRRALGRGRCPFRGGIAHRSAASREIFDAAEVLATDFDGEAVTPLHLLAAIVQSPTPAIARAVLGKPAQPSRVDVSQVRPPEARLNANPILKELGKDLVAQAIAGQIRPQSGFEAQSKAVLQVLRQKERRSVLLIADSNDVAQHVLETVACALAAKDAPEGLRGRRLLDITGANIIGGRHQSKHLHVELEPIEKLLDKAARSSETILVLPALTTGSKDCRSQWVSLVGRVLETGSMQFICHVSEQMFEDHIRRDSIWKRRTRVIWIEQVNQRSVPREL